MNDSASEKNRNKEIRLTRSKRSPKGHVQAIQLRSRTQYERPKAKKHIEVEAKTEIVVEKESTKKRQGREYP